MRSIHGSLLSIMKNISWTGIKIENPSSEIISLHCAIYDQSSRPWDENASSNSTQLGEIISGVEFAVKSIFYTKFTNYVRNISIIST